MGYIKFLRDHRIILGILGLLSLGHGALVWFGDDDLFHLDFLESEFTEKIETIVKYSMEITAGFNWILDVVLLNCIQLNSHYAKPTVIALAIGLISALPLPLRHSGGE